MAGNSEPLSPRAKLAVTAGKAAAAVSRAAGRGSGSVIGGKVALRLDPDLLGAAGAAPGRGPGLGDQRQDHHDPADRRGAAGRRPGRLQRARRQHARRASPPRSPAARTRSYGVIEVDEKYLAGVARDIDAQGHRAAQPLPRPARPRRRDPDAGREVARGPRRLEGRDHRQRRRPAGRLGRLLLPERGVGRRRPGVEGRRLVLPVLRRRDAAPRRRLVLRRVRLPPPDAELGALRRPRPRPARLRLADPPPAARAAPTRPTPPPRPPSPPSSACRRRSRWSACTRCRPSPAATTWCSSWSRELRLLLAKNPAGWLETFSLIDPPPTPVILSVNARGADGTDTSWLWDVDYTRLAGHPIFVIGDRKLDLAVRLEVAGLRLPGLRDRSTRPCRWPRPAGSR